MKNIEETLYGYSRNYFLSKLDYNAKTGVLSWRRKVGLKPAGTLKDGYLRLVHQGKVMYAHRVIYFMQTGEAPTELVDHINGKRNDNRWVNLRGATSQQNIFNSCLRKHGKVKSKGVHVCNTTGRYRVQIKHNGRNRHIGRFDTVKEAKAAYTKAAQELFGDFARC